MLIIVTIALVVLAAGLALILPPAGLAAVFLFAILRTAQLERRRARSGR